MLIIKILALLKRFSKVSKTRLKQKLVIYSMTSNFLIFVFTSKKFLFIRLSSSQFKSLILLLNFAFLILSATQLFHQWYYSSFLFMIFFFFWISVSGICETLDHTCNGVYRNITFYPGLKNEHFYIINYATLIFCLVSTHSSFKNEKTLWICQIYYKSNVWAVLL